MTVTFQFVSSHQHDTQYLVRGDGQPYEINLRRVIDWIPIHNQIPQPDRTITRMRYPHVPVSADVVDAFNEFRRAEWNTCRAKWGPEYAMPRPVPVSGVYWATSESSVGRWEPIELAAMQSPRMPNIISDALAVLRWSQRGLAAALGVSEHRVRNWIEGRSEPPAAVLTWLTDLAAYHRAHPPPDSASP